MPNSDAEFKTKLGKIIADEQTRRKKVLFRAKELNVHKNGLLQEANDHLTKLQNPMQLLGSLNALLARDDAWEQAREERRGKKRGWHFFDTIFKLQVELLEHIQSSKHTDEELTTVKNEVENIYRILRIRLENPIRLDEKFLQVLKKFNAVELRLDQDHKLAIKQQVTKDKNRDSVSNNPAIHYGYTPQFHPELHRHDSAAFFHAPATVHHASATAHNPQRKRFPKKSVPVKGVAVILDIDYTSLQGHASKTISAISSSLEAWFKPQPVDEGVLKGGFQSIVSNKEKELAKKRYNDFLQSFFKNSTIRKIDLELPPAIILKKLAEIPGFMSHLVACLNTTNLSLENVEKLTLDQFVRPFVYALQHDGKDFKDDQFYWHCVRQMQPMPVNGGTPNGVKMLVEKIMSLQEKGKKPRDQIKPYTLALFSLNDHCDNTFFDQYMLPKTFGLTADQRAHIQLEIHPSSRVASTERITKLGEMILYFIRTKMSDGYYPQEIIFADDTIDVINNTDDDVMDFVIAKLRHEMLQAHFSGSRDAKDKSVAKHITKDNIEEAADAVMDAIEIARQKNGLIHATGDHFKQIFDCLPRAGVKMEAKSVDTDHHSYRQ